MSAATGDSIEVPADVPKFLHILAQRTAVELWKAARREPNVASLTFANARGTGAHRVSEQEARSIAQRLIADSGYYFSIETPTPGLHNFSGKADSLGRSAVHDMSLYRSPAPDTVCAHMEFKQGHRSEGKDGVQVIYKDLVKLVDSGLNALWFHSFPKPTRNEYLKLQKFFSEALTKTLAKAKARDNSRVTFAFCAVLDQGAWISSPVDWGEAKRLIEEFPVASQSVAHEWQFSYSGWALRNGRWIANTR